MPAPPSMKIPISRNFFGEDELLAVQQPLRDGWVVQGARVREFEDAFAKSVGVPWALACSSGTAALHIAVKALGIRPGDEVIVPAFTWVATANVVELSGATPVFCDIDLATFNLDTAQLDGLVTPRTVGILPVHLFGLCAEMDEIRRVAQRRGLWVVEDAACALGSTYRGAQAGSLGNLGCFSFHPRKSITTGEGGMVTTNDQALARQCDGLRNHGAVPPSLAQRGQTGHSSLLPAYEIPGFNYRLTDIQGSLGAAQMRRLDFLLAERRRCADFYNERLKDLRCLRLPTEPAGLAHSWQSYVAVFAPEQPTLENCSSLETARNRLMKGLESDGIATRQGTHAPPHLDYYRAKYGIKPDNFPAAWMAERLTIALPVFPGMKTEELEYVADRIQERCGQKLT